MKDCDVFILGGGLAGAAAAAGAARCGARVVLAERGLILGGTATGALVTPMQTFHSPVGRVIGGFAQEMIEALKATGATPGHLYDPIGFSPSVTPADPDALAEFLSRFLKNERVEVLTGAGFKDVDVKDGVIESVTLEGGGVTLHVRADFFVDASGDAVLAHAAGAAVEIDANCQPMTLIFIMDRVDGAEIVEYQKKHPEEFYMPEDVSVLDRGYIGVSGFFGHVRRAREAGRLSVPRDRLLFFGTTRPGEVAVNTTRVSGFRGIIEEEVEEAKRIALGQVKELARFVNEEIPGFANARVVRTAERIGVRETRRLIGRYVMNEKDVIETAHFDDAIAKGAYPMDMHLPDSGLKSEHVGGKGFYDIPLRSLLSNEIANLVLAGKHISVTHEGFCSTRVMPTCMATGQAAGAAAALAARARKDPEEIYGEIQEALRKQGAVVFDGDVVRDELYPR